MDISNFLEIEKKYDLFHREIEGIQPWQFFRMGFWNYQICRNILGLSDSITKLGKWERIHSTISNIPRIFCQKKRVKKSELIFFAHERRVWNGRYYECIYTDELVKRYANSMILERPYHMKHLTPIQPQNIYYTDMIGMRSLASYFFHLITKSSKYNRVFSQIQQQFQEPLFEIGEKYQVGLCYSEIYKQLTRIVLENIIIRRNYERILDKAAPRLVVEVVYYSRQCMILNELAKEKGIPTIELQHGTMHSAHAAYQFPDECGEIKQFPDYVFVFSEYWKECSHLPISEDHIKVTGYPYFERQLNRYKSGHSKEDKVNIIFVSQGTIGIELSRLASELCDLIDENFYHIIYKLHPGEYAGWRERTPWLLKSNIEVVDSLEHNIYEYFAKSSIQVGVYSTAMYEGLGFGLKTYIYNIGHADTMAALCEQGYASYVSNAQELFESISGKNSNTVQDGKEFWKMNSFENICYEIDQLLVCQRNEDRS